VVLRPEAVLSLLQNSLGPALGADREAVLSLLQNSLGPALGADRVACGGSSFYRPDRPFGASLGETVASSILNLTDDATRPGLAGSYDSPVVCAGRLVSILHNNKTASLAAAAAGAAAGAETGGAASDGPSDGTASTGNASRDGSERMRTFVEPAGEFGHRPGVRPSVLVVEAPRVTGQVTGLPPRATPRATGRSACGPSSSRPVSSATVPGCGPRSWSSRPPGVRPSVLVVEAPGATFSSAAEAGVERGLLVSDVIGAFVIDPASGDFSVTTAGAWALEGGRPAHPVRRAMLSGNVYEILRQVRALVGEPEEVRGSFSVLSPSWVVDAVTVI